MNLKTPCFLISLILAFIACDLTAQSGKSPKNDKEESRIGYGINVGNIRFYNRTFELGLAPNVAYRVSESLAMGFMMKLDYYYAKYVPQNLKFSAFDLGPTVFTRYKPLWSWETATPFLRGLFLQAEYERAFIAREKIDEMTGGLVVKGNRIVAERVGDDYLYLGIGASSGYPFSTFVSLHYNVLDDFDSARNPFTYRLGFTYNY